MVTLTPTPTPTPTPNPAPAPTRWVERDSERVAHSEEYLRCVAGASGLLLRSLQVISVRTEAHTPLQGHLCVVELKSLP